MDLKERNKTKLSFSGHDTFACRQQWLKKGYDYKCLGKKFNDEDAVVVLGVGKNMVSAIKFWMRAFDLVDVDENPTELAHKIFADNGWDPYLEDEASLWILHYHLVKKGMASTYFLIFNELRREKVEFTRSNFISFIKRKEESGAVFQANAKTLAEDFGVFLKMYLRNDVAIKDPEDSFSGIFTELNLVTHQGKRSEEIYSIQNSEKEDIPEEVILYTVLQHDNFDKSLSLNTLEQEENQAGPVFAISKTGLTSKILSLVKKYPGITYSDHAGIRELQFKEKPEPFKVLEDYYAN